MEISRVHIQAEKLELSISTYHILQFNESLFD